VTKLVTPRRRWIGPAIAILGLLLAIALIRWVVKEFAMHGDSKKKRAIQEITLVKPPPPTPPPKVEPPKVVPPKQEIQEKVDVPRPDQQPDKPEAPPPGPNLGVDAVGTGSGDGFGLVGKKGGSDLIGGTGAGAGNKFAWYGAMLKVRIQEAILKDKKLREAANYRLQVNVWVDSTGAVTRAELVGSSDDAELDKALKAVLTTMTPLREGAPGDMPQPIKLRISAR
jgi:protein TonB